LRLSRASTTLIEAKDRRFSARAEHAPSNEGLLSERRPAQVCEVEVVK
jgi:hypothetical protein